MLTYVYSYMHIITKPCSKYISKVYSYFLNLKLAFIKRLFTSIPSRGSYVIHLSISELQLITTIEFKQSLVDQSQDCYKVLNRGN